MVEGGREPIGSIPASYQTVHTHRGHVDCTATTRGAHRGRRTARALRPQLTALACTTTGPAPGMQIPVPDRSSEPLPATQRASLVHLRCGTQTGLPCPSSTPRAHATATVHREPNQSSKALPRPTGADPRRRKTSMRHQAHTVARPTAHPRAVARCSETM